MFEILITLYNTVSEKYKLRHYKLHWIQSECHLTKTNQNFMAMQG